MEYESSKATKLVQMLDNSESQYREFWQRRTRRNIMIWGIVFLLLCITAVFIVFGVGEKSKYVNFELHFLKHLTDENDRPTGDTATDSEDRKASIYDKVGELRPPVEVEGYNFDGEYFNSSNYDVRVEPESNIANSLTYENTIYMQYKLAYFHLTIKSDPAINHKENQFQTKGNGIGYDKALGIVPSSPYLAEDFETKVKEGITGNYINSYLYSMYTSVNYQVDNIKIDENTTKRVVTDFDGYSGWHISGFEYTYKGQTIKYLFKPVNMEYAGSRVDRQYLNPNFNQSYIDNSTLNLRSTYLVTKEILVGGVIVATYKNFSNGYQLATNTDGSDIVGPIDLNGVETYYTTGWSINEYNQLHTGEENFKKLINANEFRMPGSDITLYVSWERDERYAIIVDAIDNYSWNKVFVNQYEEDEKEYKEWLASIPYDSTKGSVWNENIDAINTYYNEINQEYDFKYNQVPNLLTKAANDGEDNDWDSLIEDFSAYEFDWAKAIAVKDGVSNVSEIYSWLKGYMGVPVEESNDRYSVLYESDKELNYHPLLKEGFSSSATNNNIGKWQVCKKDELGNITWVNIKTDDLFDNTHSDSCIIIRPVWNAVINNIKVDTVDGNTTSTVTQQKFSIDGSGGKVEGQYLLKLIPSVENEGNRVFKRGYSLVGWQINESLLFNTSVGRDYAGKGYTDIFTHVEYEERDVILVESARFKYKKDNDAKSLEIENELYDEYEGKGWRPLDEECEDLSSCELWEYVNKYDTDINQLNCKFVFVGSKTDLLQDNPSSYVMPKGYFTKEGLLNLTAVWSVDEYNLTINFGVEDSEILITDKLAYEIKYGLTDEYAPYGTNIWKDEVGKNVVEDQGNSSQAATIELKFNINTKLYLPMSKDIFRFGYDLVGYKIVNVEAYERCEKCNNPFAIDAICDCTKEVKINNYSQIYLASGTDTIGYLHLQSEFYYADLILTPIWEGKQITITHDGGNSRNGSVSTIIDYGIYESDKTTPTNDIKRDTHYLVMSNLNGGATTNIGFVDSFTKDQMMFPADFTATNISKYSSNHEGYSKVYVKLYDYVYSSTFSLKLNLSMGEDVKEVSLSAGTRTKSFSDGYTPGIFDVLDKNSTWYSSWLIPQGKMSKEDWEESFEYRDGYNSVVYRYQVKAQADDPNTDTNEDIGGYYVEGVADVDQLTLVTIEIRKVYIGEEDYYEIKFIDAVCKVDFSVIEINWVLTENIYMTNNHQYVVEGENYDPEDYSLESLSKYMAYLRGESTTPATFIPDPWYIIKDYYQLRDILRYNMLHAKKIEYVVVAVSQNQYWVYSVINNKLNIEEFEEYRLGLERNDKLDDLYLCEDVLSDGVPVWQAALQLIGGRVPANKQVKINFRSEDGRWELIAKSGKVVKPLSYLENWLVREFEIFIATEASLPYKESNNENEYRYTELETDKIEEKLFYKNVKNIEDWTLSYQSFLARTCLPGGWIHKNQFRHGDNYKYTTMTFPTIFGSSETYAYNEDDKNVVKTYNKDGAIVTYLSVNDNNKPYMTGAISGKNADVINNSIWLGRNELKDKNGSKVYNLVDQFAVKNDGQVTQVGTLSYKLAKGSNTVFNAEYSATFTNPDSLNRPYRTLVYSLANTMALLTDKDGNPVYDENTGERLPAEALMSTMNNITLGVKPQVGSADGISIEFADADSSIYKALYGNEINKYNMNSIYNSNTKDKYSYEDGIGIIKEYKYTGFLNNNNLEEYNKWIEDGDIGYNDWISSKKTDNIIVSNYYGKPNNISNDLENYSILFQEVTENKYNTDDSSYLTRYYSNPSMQQAYTIRLDKDGKVANFINIESDALGSTFTERWVNAQTFSNYYASRDLVQIFSQSGVMFFNYKFTGKYQGLQDYLDNQDIPIEARVNMYASIFANKLDEKNKLSFRVVTIQTGVSEDGTPEYEMFLMGVSGDIPKAEKYSYLLGETYSTVSVNTLLQLNHNGVLYPCPAQSDGMNYYANKYSVTFENANNVNKEDGQKDYYGQLSINNDVCYYNYNDKKSTFAYSLSGLKGVLNNNEQDIDKYNYSQEWKVSGFVEDDTSSNGKITLEIHKDYSNSVPKLYVYNDEVSGVYLDMPTTQSGGYKYYLLKVDGVLTNGGNEDNYDMILTITKKSALKYEIIFSGLKDDYKVSVHDIVLDSMPYEIISYLDDEAKDSQIDIINEILENNIIDIYRDNVYLLSLYQFKFFYLEKVDNGYKVYLQKYSYDDSSFKPKVEDIDLNILLETPSSDYKDIISLLQRNKYFLTNEHVKDSLGFIVCIPNGDGYNTYSTSGWLEYGFRINVNIIDPVENAFANLRTNEAVFHIKNIETPTKDYFTTEIRIRWIYGPSPIEERGFTIKPYSAPMHTIVDGEEKTGSEATYFNNVESAKISVISSRELAEWDSTKVEIKNFGAEEVYTALNNGEVSADYTWTSDNKIDMYYAQNKAILIEIEKKDGCSKGTIDYGYLDNVRELTFDFDTKTLSGLSGHRWYFTDDNKLIILLINSNRKAEPQKVKLSVNCKINKYKLSETGVTGLSYSFEYAEDGNSFVTGKPSELVHGSALKVTYTISEEYCHSPFDFAISETAVGVQAYQIVREAKSDKIIIKATKDNNSLTVNGSLLGTTGQSIEIALAGYDDSKSAKLSFTIEISTIGTDVGLTADSLQMNNYEVVVKYNGGVETTVPEGPITHGEEPTIGIKIPKSYEKSEIKVYLSNEPDVTDYTSLEYITISGYDFNEKKRTLTDNSDNYEVGWLEINGECEILFKIKITDNTYIYIKDLTKNTWFITPADSSVGINSNYRLYGADYTEWTTIDPHKVDEGEEFVYYIVLNEGCDFGPSGITFTQTASGRNNIQDGADDSTSTSRYTKAIDFTKTDYEDLVLSFNFYVDGLGTGMSISKADDAAFERLVGNDTNRIVFKVSIDAVYTDFKLEISNIAALQYPVTFENWKEDGNQKLASVKYSVDTDWETLKSETLQDVPLTEQIININVPYNYHAIITLKLQDGYMLNVQEFKLLFGDNVKKSTDIFSEDANWSNIFANQGVYLVVPDTEINWQTSEEFSIIFSTANSGKQFDLKDVIKSINTADLYTYSITNSWNSGFKAENNLNTRTIEIPYDDKKYQESEFTFISTTTDINKANENRLEVLYPTDSETSADDANPVVVYNDKANNKLVVKIAERFFANLTMYIVVGEVKYYNLTFDHSSLVGGLSLGSNSNSYNLTQDFELSYDGKTLENTVSFAVTNGEVSTPSYTAFVLRIQSDCEFRLVGDVYSLPCGSNINISINKEDVISGNVTFTINEDSFAGTSLNVFTSINTNYDIDLSSGVLALKTTADIITNQLTIEGVTDDNNDYELLINGELFDSSKTYTYVYGEVIVVEYIIPEKGLYSNAEYEDASWKLLDNTILYDNINIADEFETSYNSGEKCLECEYSFSATKAGKITFEKYGAVDQYTFDLTKLYHGTGVVFSDFTQTNEESKGFTANLYIGEILIGVLSVTGHENLCNITETNTTCDVPYGAVLTIDISLNSAADQNVYNPEDPTTYIEDTVGYDVALTNNGNGTADIVLTNVVDRSDLVNDGIRLPKLNLYLNRYAVDSNIFAINTEYCLQSESLDNFDPWDESSQYYYVQYGTYQVVLQESYYTPTNVDVLYIEEEYKYILVNDVLKINDESCGNKFESDNGYNFSAYLDINENLTNVELNSKPNRYAIEFVLEPEMSDLPDDIDLKFYINAYLPDDAYLYTDMAWKTEGQRDDVSDKNIEVKYNDGLGKYIMYYSHDHVCDDSNCIHKDFWFTFDNEYNYPTYKLEFAYQNANGDKIESPLDAKDGKQYRFKVIAELITYSINLEGDNKSVENLSVYTMNTNGSSVQEIVVTPNTGYRFSTDGHIEEFKDVTLQLSTKLDDTDDEEDNPTEYEDYIIFRIYKNGVVKYSFDGDDFKEINISSSGFTYDEVSKYSFNLNLGTKRVRFYFVEKPYLTTDYEIVFSLGVIYEFEADLTLTFKVAPNKYGLFLKESDGCDIFEELEYSYATINDVYYDKEISLVYTINAAYTNLKNLKFTRGTEVFEYGDGPFFGSEITERKIEDNKLTIVIKVKGPLGYITISADKNEYTTGLYYRNGEEVVAWDHNTHKHLLQPSVDTSNAKHGEEVTLVIDEVIGNVFTSFEVRTYDSENNNFSLIPSCKISDLTFDDNNKASTDDGLFTITKAWLRDIEGSECTNDKQLSYTITYTQTSNMDFVLNVEAREIKVTFNYIKPSYNPESDKTEYVASDYMREDVIYNTSWSEYKTYLLESCDFQFSGFAGLAFAGFIKLDASAIDGYTYQWTDSNDNIISLKEGIKTLDNSDKKSIFVKDKFETSELVQNFTDIDGVYYAVYTRKEITTQVYFEGVEEAPITLRWKVGMSFDDAKVWILQEGEWITYNESFGSYMNQLKTRNNMHYLSNTTYSCLATDYEERDLRNISTLATDWEELADKLEQVHYYFEDKTLTLQLNSSHEIKASVVIDGTNNIPDIRPFVKYTQEFVVKDTEGKVVIIVNTNNNSNYFYALQLVDEGTNTYNIVRYKRSVDEGSYQYTPVSYTMEDINDELLFMVGKTANNNALKLDNISSGDYWGYSTDNGSGYKLFGDNCDNYNILNKENINNTTTKFKYEVVFIDNILVEYVIELDNGTATPTQYIARVYGSELASVETIVGKFTTVGGSNYNAGFSKDVLIATYLVDPSGEGWHDKFSDKTGIDIEESDDLSKWGNAELWKSDNTIISGVTISDNKLSDDVPAGFSHYRVSLTGKRGSIEYPFLVSNNTTWNNVVNVYSTDDNYLRNGNELYNFLQVADLDLGTNATGDTMAAGEYDFYGNYNVRNGVVKITGDLLRPMFGNIANGTIDGINILGNSRAVYAAKIPDEWETSTIHFGILALSADQTVYNDEEIIGGATISNITVGSDDHERSTIDGSGETVYKSISAVLGKAPGVTVSNITNYFNVIDNLSAQGVAYEVGEISDCKNLGNISVSATSTYLPSLVVGAGICNKADIVSNCINEGSISVNENLKDETELEKVCGADAVGIVSVAGTKVTGCINKGDVKLYNAKFDSQSVSAIGICVRLELNGIIENCINHGSVTIDKYLAAKYVPGANTNRSYPTAAGIIRKASKVNSCTNTGDITNLFGTACGVVGATNIRDNIHIQGCNNVGTITGVYVSGIVFNDKELDFKTGEKKFSIKVDSSTNIGKLIGSISDDALHFLSGNILVAGVACGRYINVTNCANIGDITLDVNEVDYDNNLESWNMVIGGIAVNVGKVQGSYNIGNINGYVENVSLEAKVIAGGIWAGKYTYEVSVSDCVNGAVISYTVGEDGKITGINTLEDGSIVVYDAAYCSVKIGEDNQIYWIDNYYGGSQLYDIATFGSKLTIKRSETDNTLKVYEDSGEYAYDFSPTTNIYGYSCAGIGICSGEEISTSNKISNCYNYGNVGSYSEDPSISARFASGIGQGFSVENSENYGNVTGYLASAGVSAMLMNNYSIQTCKNYGEISLVTADDRVNDLTVDGGCVGGIVGNTVAIVLECSNSGEIVVNKIKDTDEGGIHVGGIAGRVYLDDSQEILKNSYNTGKITLKQAGCSVYAGGVLGWIQKGIVVNCYSGSTSSENDILVEIANADLYIGGVAGYIIQSEIKECYATSNIETKSGEDVIAGGFAGLIDGNCDLTNCYAVGDIDVTNCYNSCYIGKFLGNKGTSGSLNLDNCYVNSNSSVVYEGCENISTNTDGEEKTLDNIWNYVMLNWDASIWVFPTDMHPVFHDDPNAYVGYTQITNINDLKNIASGDINNIKKYVLVDDIDMSGVEWDPIDASYILINGNGCMLKNLTVTSYSKSSVFGKLENCNIVGVGIKQFSYTFKSTSLYTYVGGLANQLVNCKMVNCFAEGNIKIESSKSYITLGGLVGSIDTSIIEKCYANCELSAISSEYQVYIGGLIGEVSKECVIKNSYSNGNISANAVNPSYCGGLVACMEPYAASYKLIISNCYSRADILKNYSHTSYSGGILGGNYETTDIYNCFTTGSVICAARVNSYYGFFIARLADDDASGIYNCYHPQSQIYTTDGIANEDKNYNTTDTMEEIYKALKDSSRLNWDPDIWNLYDDSYPTLKWQND